VLMVDTQGDPLGVQVVPANTQDRDALHAPDPGSGGACLPPPRLAGPRLCRR
jgi:hypothetical protein